MKHKLIFLLAGLLLFLFSPSGFAAPYFDVYNVDDSVNGGEMGGLKVTAIFEGYDLPFVAYWEQDTEPIPLSSGAAKIENFFKLSQGGDTFLKKWTMINNSDTYLKSFTLEGFYQEYEGELFANIVFDIRNDSYCTEGSLLGLVNLNPVDENDNPLNDVTATPTPLDVVTYRGTPTTDLYASVMISFSGNGLAPGDDNTFKFFLDTDKVSAVPIPGAYLLLGSGLLCLIGIKRKTR